MRRQSKRESRKPKTAADKGKRYRCCICRKRSLRKTTMVPYYCEQHRYLREQTGLETTSQSKLNGQSEIQ